MVRQYSTANLRSLLQAVYNKINITFPLEFGEPLITHTGDRFSAYFSSNVHMQMMVGGSLKSCRAIGEGTSPVQALTNLFAEYADESNYESIALFDF